VLAGQHHTLHMLLIALGAGGAGGALMQGFPMARRAMLLISAATVVVNILWMRRRTTSPARRLWVGGLSAATAAILVWSVVRYGL
jgi:hypothetical protein